ncbi:chromate transporter [Priestia flexa]|uniref:Chromate transporter n=1 Tax=Priestia flexa TaxID=86664 RepID=A0ABU4J4F5_9BACI|nr:chromate transporter [Priestia flexa]MCA1203792.1 chromate transporter [Priestia flexa]MCM3066398.1 chromate transporter [Priestia flexa]MDW8515871.1 chromate transporter [Priestia flexa]MED4589938.1 chromate transporter [Priestia flexa]WEZ06751.1 chromate transporter [Priestia flexa]
MIYWQLFMAFFVSNILGYGGGPASIPLIQKEVVDRYGWLTVNEFSEMLAIGNALPGPIATKMAGFIGYQEAGILGAFVSLLATIAPSVILLVVLLRILYKYKDSPNVKKMTNFIRPVIAVLLGVMAYDFFASSYVDSGVWQTLFLIITSFVLMERLRVHPAIVIVGALAYGAIFLA